MRRTRTGVLYRVLPHPLHWHTGETDINGQYRVTLSKLTYSIVGLSSGGEESFIGTVTRLRDHTTRATHLNEQWLPERRGIQQLHGLSFRRLGDAVDALMEQHYREMAANRLANKSNAA